ncbi:hypothetical protein EJ04DRAFT_516291, partial [Polyplosphaeria fusca]
MSSYDLTTACGLESYLTSKSIDHVSVTPLTGGTANYVYRVVLSSSQTLIYKHAADHLPVNHSFAIDPIRMGYEDRALEILTPVLQTAVPEGDTKIVHLVSYDKEAKLLCMEDAGGPSLKAIYQDSNIDVVAIGRRAADWVAALHMCSRTTSLSLTDPHDLQANNPVGVSIYRYPYQGLRQALADFGHDATFAEFINEEYGSRLATENECVVHGDFWSGNVLVGQGAGDVERAGLTVIDWELVRRGNPATDVAQFGAEAFLLDRFRGGRGLLPAFLDAYIRAREQETGDGSVRLGRKWVQRMAVHWGVHVSFWPTRVSWTDREGGQKLVDIGVKTMKAAVAEDWEALQKSELFEHVGPQWGEIWRRV